MFHSENNTEIMKSHIVSLYKRLLIFIVKLQAIITIYCETTSDYYYLLWEFVRDFSEYHLIWESDS